jgi:hypothetical protein
MNKRPSVKPMPVISAIPEVEIRRIIAQGQSWQKISESPISTNELDLVAHPVIRTT